MQCGPMWHREKLGFSLKSSYLNQIHNLKTIAVDNLNKSGIAKININDNNYDKHNSIRDIIDVFKLYCDKTDGFTHFKEKNKESKCIFLDKKKCSVYEARPIQCRTWPFWKENMNTKEIFFLISDPWSLFDGRHFGLSEVHR